MKVAYLDTSAALKLIVEEAESAALADYLVLQPELVLVSSWLLYTEMHCAASCKPEVIGTELVREMLDQVEFVDTARKDFIDATSFPGLHSNNALHLAVALRLEASEIITYDQELIAAAQRVGIHPIHPLV